MTQRKDVLQQQAEVIAQAIRAAFPDVPLPAEARIGCGKWWREDHRRLEYRYSGDGLQIEAFFRNIEWQNLVGHTPQETRDILTRFFTTPPLAKRWTEVVGDPLLTWIAVKWSLSSMSPQALAYYLPAYLLTALPLLTILPFDALSYVEGKASPIEFVGHTIDALIPPPGLAVWEELAQLPPEVLAPGNTDLYGMSRKGEFLRFVSQLTVSQKRAIQRFVEFTFATYPFYVEPSLDSDEEEIAALRAYWIRLEFT